MSSGNNKCEKRIAISQANKRPIGTKFFYETIKKLWNKGFYFFRPLWYKNQITMKEKKQLLH